MRISTLNSFFRIKLYFPDHTSFSTQLTINYHLSK